MPSRSHLIRRIGRSASAISPTALAFVVLMAATARAADTPPQLVALFTTKVQPLILNKCAAGACHGGPSAHAPRFHRGDASGPLDRDNTLANIESLSDAAGTHGDLSAFLAAISRRHPSDATPGSLQLTPLTTQERATLERWLTAATGKAGHPGSNAAGIATATKTTTSISTAKPATAPRPNRFRAMLEAEAHPLKLPPPQEPQGIILGKDREP